MNLGVESFVAKYLFTVYNELFCFCSYNCGLCACFFHFSFRYLKANYRCVIYVDNIFINYVGLNCLYDDEP